MILLFYSRYNIIIIARQGKEHKNVIAENFSTQKKTLENYDFAEIMYIYEMSFYCYPI
jgi:hypothetical protein